MGVLPPVRIQRLRPRGAAGVPAVAPVPRLRLRFIREMVVQDVDQGGRGNMAGIKKVGHVVLGVRDPKRSIEFYTQALGMECVNYFEDMEMAFFSFGDERDHDIAVIKVPDDQPVGSSGISHTALEIDGG